MKLLSVDFQRDYTSEGGRGYQYRPCVAFLKEVFFPFLRSKGITIAEIVSDYRLPRPGDEFECCVPGTAGYMSDVPADIKWAGNWIKCMNSPDWTRDHAGEQSSSPGLPRPDPIAFTNWLLRTIGPPPAAVTLIGLTLDCCVMATAMALAHRAYKVSYLAEGVDAYSGSAEEKKMLFGSAASNWGKPLFWSEFQGITIESCK